MLIFRSASSRRLRESQALENRHSCTNLFTKIFKHAWNINIARMIFLIVRVLRVQNILRARYSSTSLLSVAHHAQTLQHTPVRSRLYATCFPKQLDRKSTRLNSSHG